MATAFDGKTSTMERSANGVRNDIRQDQYRGFIVSQGLPRYTDLAINRKLHAAGTGAGTALAPKATMPTTAGAFGLYNGGTGNTQLVVLQISAHSVSGTTGLGMSLIAGMSTAPQASAEAAYASSVNNPITPGSAASDAVFTDAVTLAGAPTWLTLAARSQVAAVEVGSGLVANVDGLFVIPPTYVLGLNVLAPTGTSALFNVGIVWAEITLELS